jgi:hypothetical protein
VAVTAKRARELALALENTTEAPHFDRVAFRTPRRIFATLARSGVDLNFMFDHARQAQFCALAPEALAPVPGGWGRMGATRCDLKKIDAATFSAALKAAHARANAPRANAPRVNAPRVNAPRVNAPRVDAPRVDAPAKRAKR